MKLREGQALLARHNVSIVSLNKRNTTQYSRQDSRHDVTKLSKGHGKDA
jgi:hypothetical protein